MKIYQLIIIVVLMMPPLCSQTNKKVDFKNYIKEYINGCDNSEEGMEWINFCMVDLKKYRKYFLKGYSSKNTTVFFQFHFLLEKNINLIEYTMGKDKQEFFVYITYDSTGKILDNIKIRESIKHSVRDKEVFYSKKDTLLEIVSFNPIYIDTLDHKFLPFVDVKEGKVNVYKIKNGKFILYETKAVSEEYWKRKYRVKW